MITPLETRTLEERGLPSGSFFSVVFRDGDLLSEHNVNWSDFSKEIAIDYRGRKRTLHVADVSNISVVHGTLSTDIDIPKGCLAFQGIRAHTTFMLGGTQDTKVVGRFVGIVKDGKIIEERYLDGMKGQIIGIRK